MIFEESYTLHNGVAIPKLALGTWFIDDDKAADPALFPVCRSRLREEAAGREAIFLFSFKSLLSFFVCPRR